MPLEANLSRPRCGRWRRLLCSALATGWLLASPTSEARPVRWGDMHVTLTAREQPIQEFLQNLFAQTDLSVSVSPAVQGNVSGVFDGRAREVFQQIARSFDLVTYDDGV